MDTSETYIKMCEKAEEIQEQFKKPIGLLGAPTDQDGIVIGIRSHDVIGDIWLPHQDQLQEMLLDKYTKCHPCVMLGLIHHFITKKDNPMFYDSIIFETYTSMEQLWLAFVMREKYGKVWNGDEWKR